MLRKYLLVIIFLISLSVYFTYLYRTSKAEKLHELPDSKTLINYDKSIFTVIGNSKIDKNKISILTEKSKFRLTIYYDMKAVKSYPVVFGSNPVDDKIKEGDNCTPEGTFKIKSFYKHPQWSKFLWLNYPTGDSWKKYSEARSKGKLKFSDSIGGQIGIHGVPENSDYLIDKKVNWTLGCISMKNKDINEIYELVKSGTVVEIIH